MKNKNKEKTNSRYWIYGKHAVKLALANKQRNCFTLMATRDSIKDLEGLENLRKKLQVKIVISKQFSEIFDPRIVHQNIALEVEGLPTKSIEDIIKETAEVSSCIIALDQLTDPHNIGAILRSAAAFSASAVLLTEHHSPSDFSTIAKISSGALELTPLIKVTNLVRCLNMLKDSGYWIIGLDGKSEKNLSDIKLNGKIIFVMGSEGKGLRRLTSQNCDILAKLPINKVIESINVSNAAAISLYEFYKQNILI